MTRRPIRPWLLLAALLLGPASARAEGVTPGEAAPALPEASWLVAPEATSLADHAGHVVFLAFWPDAEHATASPWLDVWQETHWKKGVRVLLLARVDPEALQTLVDQQSFAYPVASVASFGEYAPAAEAGESVVIDAAGDVAWRGPIEKVDTALVAKLLRKVVQAKAPPPAEGVPALEAFARRCAAVGAPTLAIEAYDQLQKLCKGTPAAEAAAAAEKELRREARTKDELAASKAFFNLVVNWMRVGDSKGKRADLAKKLDRYVEKYGDTRSGAQARTLLATLRGDEAMDAIRSFIAKQDVKTSSSSWRTSLAKPPQLEFAATRKYFWVLDTSEGPVRIRLMPEVAPMHVSSTIYLTLLGFYDGLTFHRVIPGFMAQGGCPTGTGTGNPGYSYGGEFSSSVRHDRGGLLSMANTGQPNSDGSQFFLTFQPARHLDDKHTIFGEVVGGATTLQKLEAQGTSDGATKKRLVIEKATIEVE